MPLITSKKILFLHIPKTGGTTIEAALDMHKPECFFYLNWYKNYRVCPQHLYYSELAREVEGLSEYTTFTIVRNPFDRLVSEFYHVKNPNNLAFKDFGNLTFENFVEKVFIFDSSKRKWLFDRHIEPQHLFLEGCTQIEIFKFEEIEKCFDYLKNIVDKNLSFGHERKSRARKPFQEYYNNSTRMLVEEFYKKDLEMFSYTFDV